MGHGLGYPGHPSILRQTKMDHNGLGQSSMGTRSDWLGFSNDFLSNGLRHLRSLRKAFGIDVEFNLAVTFWLITMLTPWDTDLVQGPDSWWTRREACRDEAGKVAPGWSYGKHWKAMSRSHRLDCKMCQESKCRGASCSWTCHSGRKRQAVFQEKFARPETCCFLAFSSWIATCAVDSTSGWDFSWTYELRPGLALRVALRVLKPRRWGFLAASWFVRCQHKSFVVLTVTHSP